MTVLMSRGVPDAGQAGTKPLATAKAPPRSKGLLRVARRHVRKVGRYALWVLMLALILAFLYLAITSLKREAVRGRRGSLAS